SFFSKMAGLLSFCNLVLVLLTLVVIVFLFSLVGSILLYFAAYIATQFYYIFLSKWSFYIYGLTISFLTIFFRYDKDIVNTSWEKYYLLDHYSVVLGCVIFMTIVMDYVSKMQGL